MDLKKVRRYVVVPFAPILESDESYRLKKGKDRLHKRLADLDVRIERETLLVQQQFFAFKEAEEVTPLALS